MASGYSPRLPVTRNLDDGYTLTKTLEQVATQNLKHLILTNPGERMMDPEFGVGIKKFLFEMNEEDVDYQINAKIKEQVSKYLSYIYIQRIQFQRSPDNENLIYMRITYKIPTTTKVINADFSVSPS